MIKSKIVKAFAVGGLAAALFAGCKTTSSSKDMNMQNGDMMMENDMSGDKNMDMKDDGMMKDDEMSSASKKKKDGGMQSDKNDGMMKDDGMMKKNDGMMKDM
ncbi:MAG: hypothetical protein ACTTKL_04475 [Treponema sp.]